MAIRFNFAPREGILGRDWISRLAWLTACLLPFIAAAQLVRQPNTTLNLPASLPSATGYSTDLPFGSLVFTNPVKMAVPPGETNRLFVLERTGRIQVITNLAAPNKTLFLDVSAVIAASGNSAVLALDSGDNEQGLLGLAFHPGYATNGYLYVYYVMKLTDGATAGRRFDRLTRFQVSTNNPNAGNTSSQVPMITQFDEDSNHNAGDLNFGPDGHLYVSLGDEGSGNDTRNNSRFIDKDFYSHVLRIDVDNSPGSLAPRSHVQSSTLFPSAVHAGTYRVPADNPFFGITTWNGVAVVTNRLRTEIWATGFRNPWRFNFDPPTGRLFLGDVGQGTREEVDLVVRGGDYGWNYREGLIARPGSGSPPAGTQFINPIHDYNTGDDQGRAVIGGVVYRGTRFSDLYEAYVFGDNTSGRIWALRQTGTNWVKTQIATDSGVSSFTTDPRNGDVLFTDHSENRVKRLVRSGTTGAQPPVTLSAVGAFSSLATLTPNTGIVPFEPKVAFWSDHAHKTRWFSITNLTDKIGFSTNGNWTFPTRMVWIKHFEIETNRGDIATSHRLETRFLVKTTNDIYGITYKWRADQTEADLVAEQGLSEVIPGSSPAQTWRYPSRTECRACHTAVGGFALGFNTAQLNHTNLYGGQIVNQIQALSDAGYFTQSVSNVNTLPALAQADDESVSLEWRVRSYFAANCIQCHQPGGASLGNWDARASTSTDLAGLINGLLVDDGGDATNRFATPGDTLHSMVLKRVSGLGGSPRMPPLATLERNLAAEQLLTNWITQFLPTRQTFAQWQQATFGSTNAPALASDDPDEDGFNNREEFLAGTNPQSPSSRFAPRLQVNGTSAIVNLELPTNRSFLIESSLDLLQWNVWDAAGNNGLPVPGGSLSLTNSVIDPQQFFRFRLWSN